MNKTITCNIAGLVFNVEEQAYEKLFHYLKAVKQKLKGTEGAEEVYEDIEGRVAELFTERLSTRQEVVLEKDVLAVIQALGEPEDFVLEAEDTSDQQRSERTESRTNTITEKTLMRDPENGVIAGVCSGVAAYLGWDVVFVRILFLLALIITGFGFIIYIVLWIAAPKAQTSTDRLRMRGEPINLDTIAQEVQDAVDRVEKYANGVDTKISMQKFKESGKKVGSVVTKFVGAFLVIGSFVGIAMFLTVSLTENGFFVDDDGEHFVSLFHMSKIIFATQVQSLMGWAGLLILVLIPLLYLGILGIVLLLQLKRKILGKVFLTSLIFWIIGIIMFSVVSIQIGRDFTHHEYVENHVETINSGTLKIHLPNGLDFVENDDYLEHLSHDGTTVRNSFVRIELSASSDSAFHVVTKKYASGITKKKAYRRIDNIKHELVIDSNLVQIAPIYEYPVKDCMRRQKVVVYIEVPHGGDIEWIGDVKRAYIIRDNR